MTMDIDKAKDLLAARALTCSAVKNGECVFTSTERGVKPLAACCGMPELKGAAVADKVIGRASALLTIYFGAAEVYGAVMSEAAARELENAGIPCGYGELVPAIRNRDNTGLCPMEKLSQGASSPAEMLERIQGFLREMAEKGEN